MAPDASASAGRSGGRKRAFSAAPPRANPSCWVHINPNAQRPIMGGKSDSDSLEFCGSQTSEGPLDLRGPSISIGGRWDRNTSTWEKPSGWVGLGVNPLG